MDEKKDMAQNSIFGIGETEENMMPNSNADIPETTGDHNLEEIDSWLDEVQTDMLETDHASEIEELKKMVSDHVSESDTEETVFYDNTTVLPEEETSADGDLNDEQEGYPEEPVQYGSGLADAVELEDQEKKPWSTKKRLILILGIVFGVVLIAYAVGCVYYSSHFFNRSKINDTKVSNQSVDAVVSQLKDGEKDYVLTIEKRDNSQAEIKGKDIDFKFNDNGAVAEVLKSQNYWEWPTGFFKDVAYEKELNYQYDDAKLQKSIDALGINSGANVEPAVNAHPAWQNGKVEIVPEVYGNTVNQQKLNEVVRTALKKGDEKLVLTKAGAYETPKYLSNSKEVAEAKKKMEEAVQSTLTYTIDDQVEYLDVNTFGPWLICDGNMAVTVNQEQGAAYLSSLADKYDTAGGDFNFTTSGGSQIVISGGTFGWMVDEANELPKMTTDILSGENVTRPITSKGAATRTGSKDVGKTYVEISLSGQHMWLYVDGNLIIDTPVVTGGPGHRTPSGVWKIESHEQNVTLRGSNDDGSQYASYVNYWMPFCHAEGDGIHDADGWRSSYGGDIYNYNGSHGCVNTPLSAMETFYFNTSNGCPVVIY